MLYAISAKYSIWKSGKQKCSAARLFDRVINVDRFYLCIYLSMLLPIFSLIPTHLQLFGSQSIHKRMPSNKNPKHHNFYWYYIILYQLKCEKKCQLILYQYLTNLYLGDAQFYSHKSEYKMILLNALLAKLYYFDSNIFFLLLSHYKINIQNCHEFNEFANYIIRNQLITNNILMHNQYSEITSQFLFSVESRVYDNLLFKKNIQTTKISISIT